MSAAAGLAAEWQRRNGRGGLAHQLNHLRQPSGNCRLNDQAPCRLCVRVGVAACAKLGHVRGITNLCHHFQRSDEALYAGTCWRHGSGAAACHILQTR